MVTRRGLELIETEFLKSPNYGFYAILRHFWYLPSFFNRYKIVTNRAQFWAQFVINHILIIYLIY